MLIAIATILIVGGIVLLVKSLKSDDEFKSWEMLGTSAVLIVIGVGALGIHFFL